MKREHNWLKLNARVFFFTALVIMLPTLFYMRLCKDIRKMENTKNTYTTELTEMVVAKDNLENEISVLYESKLELQKANEKYENEIITLLVEKSELKNAIFALKVTVDELKKNELSLQNKIEELIIERKALEAELASIAARIDCAYTSSQFPFVYKDGNVDDRYLMMVYEELQLLPKSILKLYQNKNVKIYVTTKNIAKDILGGRYNSVQGVTFYGENKIYIEDREIACKSATLHECGHLFNEYMGYVAKQSELQSIYQEESSGLNMLTGAYHASNADEYFAEAFAIYFKNNSSLKTNCPKTSMYIQSLIERNE